MATFHRYMFDCYADSVVHLLLLMKEIKLAIIVMLLQVNKNRGKGKNCRDQNFVNAQCTYLLTKKWKYPYPVDFCLTAQLNFFLRSQFTQIREFVHKPSGCMGADRCD